MCIFTQPTDALLLNSAKLQPLLDDPEPSDSLNRMRTIMTIGNGYLGFYNEKHPFFHR